jgi:hypothetical protein
MGLQFGEISKPQKDEWVGFVYSEEARMLFNAV